jgi:hypothetical protein
MHGAVSETSPVCMGSVVEIARISTLSIPTRWLLFTLQSTEKEMNI